MPIVFSIVKKSNNLVYIDMDVNFDALSTLPSNYDYLNGSGANITILAVLVAVIIIYYIIFASLGAAGVSTGEGDMRSGSSTALEIILWAAFILLIVFNALQYFFSINVKASLKNLFSKTPELDLVIDQQYPVSTNTESVVEPGVEPGEIIESESIPEITTEYQTFHIPDNKYTYEDAQAVCKAYGARLANYDEIEEAYVKGGEWCGYGWSADQMALYPTQKNTWQTLQGIKGHKHDCGRPGVNGGYIANPNVRFGVNCYGYKPEITPQEQQNMRDAVIYPKSKKDIEMDKRVNYWKNRLSSIQVSPFNHNSWSEV